MIISRADFCKLGAAAAAAASLAGLAGCSSSGTSPQGSADDSARNEKLGSEDVRLVVAGPWSECRAFETVSSLFAQKYPNCTVDYEYLQDYEATIAARLESDPTSVDLFFTTNIQADSVCYPYATDLYACDDLDLSETFEGLVKNFEFITEDSGAPKRLFSVPTGAEIRGMFVNKTILKNEGIEVPANKSELIEACQKLKEAGYMPMQGNPMYFAQTLMYPSIANSIANADDYEATYKLVNDCEPGLSEFFSDQMALVYELMSNRYYDYKAVETEFERFTDNSDDGVARDFLGISKNGDDYVAHATGEVPFIPKPLSLTTAIERWKSDCSSPVEYEFIPSPVDDDGGSVYLSPAQGLALSSGSAQTEWAVEFLNFFFSADIAQRFATEFGIIPNRSDALDIAVQQFDVESNHVCELGQVTFNYPFYNPVAESLLTVSKGNNPKYMKDDGKGGVELYPFDYYMGLFDEALQGAKQGSGE